MMVIPKFRTVIQKATSDVLACGGIQIARVDGQDLAVAVMIFVVDGRHVERGIGSYHDTG